MDLATEKKYGGLKKKERDLTFVLEMVKKQVNFWSTGQENRNAKDKFFIFNRVLSFSSKEVDKKNLKWLAKLFAQVLSNKDLVRSLNISIPSSWDVVRAFFRERESNMMSIVETDTFILKEQPLRMLNAKGVDKKNKTAEKIHEALLKFADLPYAQATTCHTHNEEKVKIVQSVVQIPEVLGS